MLEYWLAHGEGFRVVSRLGGRRHVNHVIVDPARGRAAAVVVRSPFRRRLRTVPAQTFSGVDPFRRVLYVDRRRRAVPARTAVSGWQRQAAGTIARFAAAVRLRAPMWRRRAECAVDAGIEWLRPRASTGARHAAIALHEAGQMYARAMLRMVEWLQPRVARIRGSSETPPSPAVGSDGSGA